MAYKDLREWMAKLQSEGELKEITAKVDWNLELAEIARKGIKEHKPALLFTNIKDHEKTTCTRLLTNVLATKGRMALGLGLPAKTSLGELIQIVRKRWRNPMTPVMVKTGPVKENILTGDDIDLFKFPVPKWHEHDGGRYIGAGHMVINS